MHKNVFEKKVSKTVFIAWEPSFVWRYTQFFKLSLQDQNSGFEFFNKIWGKSVKGLMSYDRKDKQQT